MELFCYQTLNEIQNFNEITFLDDKQSDFLMLILAITITSYNMKRSLI